MSTLKIDPQFAVAVAGLALTAAGLFLFLKKQAADTVKGAAGVVGGTVSGNNAITRGTVYEGKGVFGTLGAATNSASGGGLETLGSWIGGKLYDLTHSDEDVTAPVPIAQFAADPDARAIKRLNSEGIQP